MISWIKTGDEIVLDDRDNGKYVLAKDGFGMPAFHRFEERGPLQHGVTDRGYRLDPRLITLIIGIRGISQTDFYQKRETLLKAFKPDDTGGTLRWQEGSVVRQIEGHLIEGLNFSDSDREYLFQKAPITIKCPDPAWYDPEGKAIGFGIGGGGDTLTIPLTIPLTVGASSLNMSQQIQYNGSLPTYPIITIRGPITNCVITHSETGDKLDFTGYTISEDTVYTIDLRYGHKTVTDQNGDSQVHKLTDASDLATFRLETDPIVSGGANSIHVSGTNITASTEITLQYYEKYIGI